tara:strand:+ start:130 stop:747 length:618 start_codon:yes stop_codon:yes gene_type:complete
MKKMSLLTENIPIAHPVQNNGHPHAKAHLPLATNIVRIDHPEFRQYELESRQEDKIMLLEKKLKQQQLEHIRLVNNLKDTKGRKNNKISNLQNKMKHLRNTIKLQESALEVRSKEHDQSKEHLDTHVKETDELNIGLEKQVSDLTKTVNALRRKIKKHSGTDVSLKRTRAELRSTNIRLRDAYAELDTADGIVEKVSKAIKVWQT